MDGLWRTEPQGILSAEVGALRLVVQAPEQPGGLVRFMVLRRGSLGRLDALVGSGTEESVRESMAAAERMSRTFGEGGLQAADFCRAPQGINSEGYPSEANGQ